MRISDWSSDVCSSDLRAADGVWTSKGRLCGRSNSRTSRRLSTGIRATPARNPPTWAQNATPPPAVGVVAPLKRSEEHTSELKSLMRISYAVFCLKKTNHQQPHSRTHTSSIHQDKQK